MSSVNSQSMTSPVSDKSSTADPIPTFVLKQTIDLLAPFVAELFNRSLAAGHFPGRFKDAFIAPIVKKAGFDPTEACSYRPISNLPVLSKLMERLVARQLMNSFQPFTSTVVRFSPWTLYRISRFIRAVRCPVSSRPWRFCCVGFARPINSFRYGGL